MARNLSWNMTKMQGFRAAGNMEAVEFAYSIVQRIVNFYHLKFVISFAIILLG